MVDCFCEIKNGMSHEPSPKVLRFNSIISFLFLKSDKSFCDRHHTTNQGKWDYDLSWERF